MLAHFPKAGLHDPRGNLALSMAFFCLTLLRSQSHERDSNPRQHDSVGAENGLRRLSAESGGNGPTLGVSANEQAPKPPTNGAFLAVSAGNVGETRLVGGVHQTRTNDNN